MSLPEEISYTPRGYVVKKRTEKEIINEAVMLFLQLTQHGISLKNIESIFDICAITKELDISIHIEKNATWDRIHSKLKKGESVPCKREITIPERVFDGTRKRKSEDLEVLFHEIGHVVLNHQPVYWKSEGYIVTRLDDAEEQADYFAKIMLKLFEVDIQPKQLELF